MLKLISMRTIWCVVAVLCINLPMTAFAENDYEEEHEESAISLTAEQVKAAGIIIKKLRATDIVSQIQAPGEILLNAYATTRLTPKIAAQILQRHAVLGDVVVEGQPLLKLSSIEMAEAQGDLLAADREWKRVKKLSREVISDQLKTETRVTREQDLARVRAYGMAEKDIQLFLARGNAEQANGNFQLLAMQDGTVIRDNFIVGELVEPGRVLFEVSDESELWVEARLTPEQAADVRVGAQVNIVVRGNEIGGKVIQVHHALDESTRTLGVRIVIPNPDDLLHPGLFVQANIEGAAIEQALVVPGEAVLRSADGDWLVFVEHEPYTYEPREIEIIRSTGDTMVISGLEAGSSVVTQGAFFLQSELAKAGFEIHNH